MANTDKQKTTSRPRVVRNTPAKKPKAGKPSSVRKPSDEPVVASSERTHETQKPSPAPKKAAVNPPAPKKAVSVPDKTASANNAVAATVDETVKRNEPQADARDLYVEGQKVIEEDVSSSSAIDLLDYSTAKKNRKRGREKRERIDPTLAERYDASPDDGLNTEQVVKRINDGLTNEATKVKGRTYLRIITSNVFTYLNAIVFVIFIALALVANWRSDWSKFLFAVIAVTNTAIGIILEIRSKMTVDKLKIVTAPTAMVVREGSVRAIPVRQVVLDDIIHLETGKQICADAILVKGECEVNEALLTGESMPVHKRVGDTLYSGSFVTSGTCRARVDKIGNDNYIETLASYAKKYKKPNSELNNAINLIIKVVSIVMIPLAITLIIRTAVGINSAYPDIPFWESNWDVEPTQPSFMYRLITSVSGAVIGMVPTGMFLLTSVALALSVIRLAKRHTLVQNIYCIEMLARVDVLCLDKTGTITDGFMRVNNVVSLRSGGDPISDIVGSILSATGDNNQTAIALGDYFGYAQKFLPKTVVPFSSVRKLSAVTFEGKGTYFLGAPEYVFGEMGIKLQKIVDDYAAQGYRVMALAHSLSEIHGDRLPASRKAIGIIVIEDRIREDVIETIRWFKENDVAVKVISGDNPITVSEVAKRVGVADADKYISLEGLSAREVVEAANRYTVFGRVTPEQKSILVRSMKTKGHTVAMTGDGVNDILAMRQADCAVSMASGAEAARNVAHLILMDNNFTSMPDVVVEGRRVINNIAMSSSLYLTKTIMTILLTIACLIVGSPYFFSTNMTLMYEIFITAIPSLFLALQVNKERVQGRFMSTMLKSSIPGGVTVSLGIIATYIYWVMTSPEGVTSLNARFNTIAVIVLTFSGFMILLRLCQPFNAYRIILVVGTFGLCVLATCVMPSMFGITYTRELAGGVTETILFAPEDWLFISTIALSAYCIVQVVHSLVKAINVNPQKVEIAEAAAEKERKEEQRLLEALKREKLYREEDDKKRETVIDISSESTYTP